MSVYKGATLLESIIDKAYLGTTLLYAPAGGPSFETGVINAWDPASGADASGIVADAVGASNLWVRSGAAGVASWGGTMDGSQILCVDHADLTAFKAAATPTLTAWIYEDGANPTYSNIINNTLSGFLPGGGGVNGEWRFARSGTTDAQFTVHIGYAGGSSGQSPRVAPTGQWNLWTLRLGANKWQLFANDLLVLSNIAWSSQAWPASNVAPITVGGGAGVADHTGTFDTSGYFKGQIGDMRLWDKSLSNTEISDLFAAGRLTY